MSGRSYVAPEGHTLNGRLSCCPHVSPWRVQSCCSPPSLISRSSRDGRSFSCCPRLRGPPPWEEEGAPTAPAKPWQPCATQPRSCPPRSGPEEKPKTNIRVWRVSEAMGLKVTFRKGRESQAQTQGCLFCLHSPRAAWLLEST